MVTPDPLADWWRFAITVKPFAGSGARGPVYGEPFTFMGAVDDRRKLVRTADGQEVVSETRVFGPIDTPRVPDGSLVTLPEPFTRETRVLAVSRMTSGGLDTPNHLEVALA